MPSPLAVLHPAKSATDDTDLSRTEALALLRALQRSLEPRVVVETFARQLARDCGLEGVAFQHPEHGLAWGSLRDPAYAVRLKADGESLGQLEVYRHRALASGERERVRQLAALLVRPLRNALHCARLQRQACEDGLTGLLNRQALDRMLPRELAAAERAGQPLALVVLDINDLKLVNDVLGHAAGDRLLTSAAAAIGQSLRRSDMAFRVGGDEFVLLLPDTDEPGAAHVVARIRDVLDMSEAIPGTPGHRPGFSAGVAISTAGISPGALFELADTAMYRVKRSGRSRAPRLAEASCGKPGFAPTAVTATMAH